MRFCDLGVERAIAHFFALERVGSVEGRCGHLPAMPFHERVQARGGLQLRQRAGAQAA